MDQNGTFFIKTHELVNMTQFRAVLRQFKANF